MNRSFQRKLVYLALIAALLVPVALLGRPAAFDPESLQDAGGGKLAELRTQYKLGQAQLGKIDPTSSAVRYVSLGLHGVAVCVLQQQAAEYFKQEDWIGFSAALNQLTYLQPYYVKVWTFQSWNVSYNLSSQWDDFREKYYWVIRGFKLLHQGMQFNELEPGFPYDLGWHMSHKLGQSDERREYRRLFAADKQTRRELLPISAEFDDAWADERDSWLYGKRYLRYAQEMVDHRGGVLRSVSPENFHLQIPIAQTKYAEALEAEGVFGEKARSAWRQAAADWTELGRREFPSEHGFFYRIEDLDRAQDDLDAALKRLEAFAPGLRDRLLEEKQAKLTDEERRALALDSADRSVSEARLAYEAGQKSQVTDFDVADNVTAADRTKARAAADEIALRRLTIGEIQNARKIYNYQYWQDRCAMEQQDDALAARELFYKGVRDAADNPWRARTALEDAFRKWRGVLDKYPGMRDDQTAYEVQQYVEVYRDVLKQLDEPFDEKSFVLRELLKLE